MNTPVFASSDAPYKPYFNLGQASVVQETAGSNQPYTISLAATAIVQPGNTFIAFDLATDQVNVVAFQCSASFFLASQLLTTIPIFISGVNAFTQEDVQFSPGAAIISSGDCSLGQQGTVSSSWNTGGMIPVVFSYLFQETSNPYVPVWNKRMAFPLPCLACDKIVFNVTISSNDGGSVYLQCAAASALAFSL